MDQIASTIVVPAGMEPLSRTPLAVGIGMVVTGCAGEQATASMAPTPAVLGPAVAEVGASGIDPLALLPLLDQLSSFPVAAALGGATAMATIDLTVAFSPVAITGAVTARARAITAQGAARLVTGEVMDAAGVVVATSSAWFSIGAPPGGGPHAPDPAPRAIDRSGPFQAMIGLAPHGDDGARLAPDVWEAIGYVGMPALHGGAIAAALARAGQRRVETLGRADLTLAGITIRYLRAAAASGAIATATVDTMGRRTARLSARMEVAGETVATAQMLFVVP